MPRKGVAHHYAKLNPDAVRDIRARRARGETVKQIWSGYPDIASEGTINAVVYGRTWKDVQ